MGYLRYSLLNAGLNFAISELLPALPDLAGSALSNHCWDVEFYALCKANPKASFCCSKNKLVHEGAVDNKLYFTHARIGRDNLGSLKIRASTTETAQPINKKWLLDKKQVIIEGTTQHAGVELIAFKRREDGLEFIGAKTHIAAQTAASELANTYPLWRQLFLRT